jgi:hypothetical protein
MRLYGSRSRRTQKRLRFESLEPRQMMTAEEILFENGLTPASQPYELQFTLPAPGGFQFNGSVDSTFASQTRIQGYTSKPSYNLGELVEFKIDAMSSYDVYIFRRGWYGGVG